MGLARLNSPRSSSRRAIATLLTLSIAVAIPSASPRAHAYPGAPTGPVGDAEKQQAKQRFDRALELFEEGDNGGALAEFQAAYRLTGNLVVLYNIGLVHEKLAQYVEAFDALSEVLSASPDPLQPEWHQRAEETRARAKQRIGTIAIDVKLAEASSSSSATTTTTTSAALEGAVIELDGVDVGRWPLAAPMRASTGKHVVGVLAAGYAPARKDVSVAGESQSTVVLELVPMEGKAAQLRIVSSVPKAQIFVDGELVGSTPLLTSLPVRPGKRVVELRRPGYATASTVLELSAGATGDAKLEPREDPAEVATLGAKVLITESEPEATLTIDGAPRDATIALPIAPGPHHLHAERTGFHAIDRDFDVEAGATTTLQLVLIPTPETLASYDASLSRHHTWGLIGLVSGVVFAGAGAFFFAGYSKNKKDLDARSAAYAGEYQVGGVCSGNAPPGVQLLTVDQCNAQGDAIDADRRSNGHRLDFALASFGLGALGLGVGIYSFVSAERSGRFDAVRSRAAASLPLSLSVMSAPSTYGLTLSGAF